MAPGISISPDTYPGRMFPDTLHFLPPGPAHEAKAGLPCGRDTRTIELPLASGIATLPSMLET